MDAKRDGGFLAAGCLAVSAVLFFLGSGLAPMWPLMWLAAIPVLWAGSRLGAWQTFGVAAGAYAIGFLNEWSYLGTVLAAWIVVLLIVVIAGLFGLGVVLFRWGLVRGKVWQAVVLFPAYWAGVEFLISRISVHGTFFNIGYTQMNFLPVVQIASVTGIWGIGFTVFLFAAAVAALPGPGARATKIWLAIGSAVFIAGVIGFGVWRLAATPKSPMVKVALVASDAPENLNLETAADGPRILERYAERVRLMEGKGVQLFVLPENVVPVDDTSVAGLDDLVGGLAKEAGAYVEIGVSLNSGKVARNQERLYAPDGTLAATYNKEHLLPPGENRYTPGTARAVVAGSAGEWGLEICKDLDFPGLSREYARDGIGLLIVPASDFVYDGWLHGRMAMLRGVESGFSMARSAKLGVLTASDDRGRVLAERETIGPVFAVAVAEVPVRHDGTVYSRFGDWFAWVCLGMVVGLVFWVKA